MYVNGNYNSTSCVLQAVRTREAPAPDGADFHVGKYPTGHKTQILQFHQRDSPDLESLLGGNRWTHYRSFTTQPNRHRSIPTETLQQSSLSSEMMFSAARDSHDRFATPRSHSTALRYCNRKKRSVRDTRTAGRGLSRARGAVSRFRSWFELGYFSKPSDEARSFTECRHHFVPDPLAVE